MRRRIINRAWFAQPTLLIAPELIGKVLVRRVPTGIWRYRITEVEAYCGVRDLACHASPVRNRLVRGSENLTGQVISNGASRGKTQRTAVMFGPAGYIYVYLIYGMYHCLNLVTALEGKAEAILIRSVEPLFPTSQKPVGPGRLCRELNIDSKLNCQSLSRRSGLWVEDDGFKLKPEEIGQSARRGITYAKDYASKPWRFYLKTNKFVS